MINKTYKIIVCIILFSAIGYSQSGGAPGEFLNLSSGARSFGMGGTAFGLIDDASSVFINPGMVGLVYDVNFNVTLGKLQFDRNYYDLALVYPLNNIGNFGIGWCQLGIDNILGRDQYGFVTQKFSDLQSAFVFSYGRMIGDIFSMGFSTKYLLHSLAGYSANGTAIDFGASFLIGDFITVGGVVRNITSSLKWNTSSNLEEELPMKIGLGMSYYEPVGIPNIVLSSDFSMSGGEFSKYNVGAEYVLKDMFIFRGGYSTDGYAVGGGLMYGGFKLDVAYNPEPFGDASRLYFTLNWLISPGEIESTEEYEEEPFEEGVEPFLPEPEEEQKEKSIVLITDGPLKFEKAEVIKTNVANNTITVRLLALPDSTPVTLRMDQVRYIK